MKIISIPFQFRGVGHLGAIYRPYIIVTIKSRLDEWIPIEMIIDTGADYTLLPHKYAQILGINLKKDCFLNETYGIGGKERVYLYKRGIFIKIHNWHKKIPVGFLSRDDTPALLGRLQGLETIKLIMQNHVTTLEE